MRTGNMNAGIETEQPKQLTRIIQSHPLRRLLMVQFLPQQCQTSDLNSRSGWHFLKCLSNLRTLVKRVSLIGSARKLERVTNVIPSSAEQHQSTRQLIQPPRQQVSRLLHLFHYRHKLNRGRALFVRTLCLHNPRIQPLHAPRHNLSIQHRSKCPHN